MQTIYGIYVPGLGDRRTMGQDSAVRDWKVAKFEYFPLKWADDEPFEAKLQRLLKQIDTLYEKSGEPIVLMGASAGASAIINAYVRRKDKVVALIYICGKIQNPGGINQSYFKQNPAFKASVFSLQSSLKQLTVADKAKILSVRSIFDGLIPTADTKIPGVKEKVLPMVGHVTSIAFALALYKRPIGRFIRQQFS